MRNSRFLRLVKALSCGGFLLQIGACDFDTVNTILQTVFLGITAAGGVAILQNI